MRKRVYSFLMMLSFLLVLVSCTNNGPKDTKKTLIIYNNLDETQQEIVFDNEDTFSIGDLPNYSESENVFLGYSLSENGELLEENIEYELYNGLKLYAKYGIRKDFFHIDTVAEIYITCPTEIISKENYEAASIVFFDHDFGLRRTPVNIRLRGNSSLMVDKKSYKLKFDEKIDLFNMGADKEWALIANYYDPSFLRNYYAYKLANAMGMEYSVECKFANVYLNGINQGLYLFCETIKTSKERVNIEEDYAELEEEIPFMIELDHKMTESGVNYELIDNEFFFIDKREVGYKHYPIAAQYPKTFTSKHVSNEQYNYLKNYMINTFESVLNGTYNDYIDMDSFIDYYLIQELFMNIDLDYSSVFMYKPLGEKLHFGPVWDFDISAGNCRYVEKYDPFMPMKDVNYGSYLFNSLMQEQEVNTLFHSRLEEIGQDIIPVMLKSFDYNLEIIAPYSEVDDSIWHTLDEGNWVKPDHLVGISYDEHVNYLHNYLESHYYWILSNM